MGNDNLSHPYTHVLGKMFVAASVIITFGFFSDELENLKEGEEDKSKTYVAYCISEQALDSLEDLNNLISPNKSFIEIQQKTPIRVLHRRTLTTRPKKIYEINAQFCDGYSDRFLLKISTQAGTNF